MDVAQRNATTAAGLLAVVVNGVDAVVAASAAFAAAGALILLFFSLGAEVIVRYLTTQGLGWPSEMPNILFPWLVMGGVVLAAQRGAHISVVLLLEKVNRTVARIILLLMQVVVAAAFFHLAWAGLTVIEITGGETYPVTGVSASWAYLSLILGFFAVGVTAVTTFVRLLPAEDPLAVRAPAPEEEA